MNTGELRRQVTIQEPLRAPDGGGGFTTLWQDIAANPAVFAGIAAAGGGEELRDQQLVETRSWRIIMRWRGDLNAGMRLVEGSMVYNIRSLRDPDGSRTWLEVLATSP